MKNTNDKRGNLFKGFDESFHFEKHPNEIKLERLERPKMYDIIMVGTDRDSNLVAAQILKKFFKKSESDVASLLKSTSCNKIVINTSYTREVAETKADEIIKYSRKLQVTIRPIIKARDENVI